ncbi:MAG: hypothetical protein RAK20_06365 [Conexivisphaerales archaeon]|nr:hypothetical protein [Conexivisphaerales archaeon]
MPRSLIDVINTQGYVTTVEGQPGIGKTTLALKACTSRGGCTYISYADPEISIKAKLKALGSNATINVINVMSGSIETVFSEIVDDLQKGELVIVDSLDAMFYGIENERGIRPFLQLIYGSAKLKSGSLVLISEGLNPVAKQVRFVSDAIISIELKEILGKLAREATLLKDRDFPVEKRSYFLTWDDGLRIIEPVFTDVSRKPKNVHAIRGPPETSFKYIIPNAYRVLTVLGNSIHPAIADTIKQWVVSDFLKYGYGVNLLISSKSNESSEREAIESMTGGKNMNMLNIISINDPEVKRDAKKYYRTYIDLIKTGNYVNVVDLLAHEPLAVTDPSGYEAFISDVSEFEREKRIPVALYGYQDYTSVRIVSKYVHMQWSTEMVNGTLFYLTVKPDGPLYFIDADIENGKAEFKRLL